MEQGARGPHSAGPAKKGILRNKAIFPPGLHGPILSFIQTDTAILTLFLALVPALAASMLLGLALLAASRRRLG